MGPKDSEYLKKLYFQQAPAMFRYAMVILRDPSLAEDAVQAAFQTAAERSEELQGSPNPVGWLRQTLKYKIRSILREEYRRKKLWERLSESREPVYNDISLQVEYLGVDREALALLERVYVEKIPYQQLADEQGISLSALKMRVNRAKKKIKDEIT